MQLPKGHREPHVEMSVSVDGTVSVEACGCLSATQVAEDLREAIEIVMDSSPIKVRRVEPE